MSSQPTVDTEARDAFEYLMKTLGTPTHHSIESLKSTVISSGYEATWLQITQGDTGTFHPVFKFAHHFRSKDSYATGYTGNHSRGDHLSTPGFTEDGRIAVIDVSFHKGNTSINVVTFDAQPEESPDAESWQSKYDAALVILEENETR